MGNTNSFNGYYGINDLILCELKNNKLMVPFYDSTNDIKLKWFHVGTCTNEVTKLKCTYMSPKNSTGQNLYPGDYVTFYKTKENVFVMNIDGLEFQQIPYTTPSLNLYTYYVTNNIMTKSVMTQTKNACFTLSIYVKSKTYGYDEISTDNVYKLIIRNSK